MKVLSIALARAIALFDVGELNPHGRAAVHKLVPMIAERFSFQVVPTKPEDFQGKDGLEFRSGHIDGQMIANMTIYNDGIKVDVHSSTEEAQVLLKGALQWLADQVGLYFSEKLLNRWAFLSQIIYQSDVDIDLINPALRGVGDQISKLVGERTHLPTNFRVNQIVLNFDRTYYETPLSSFSIERRAKAPFDEGKYFSAAPLQTRDHLRLLDKFESDLRSQTVHQSRKGATGRTAQAVHKK